VWVSFDVAGGAESGVDDFLVVGRGRGEGFFTVVTLRGWLLWGRLKG
jgi:hypothetical protein